MTTNTTKLRRALETFAKTGKITLTASALMALALSAPVNAAEKNFSESVIIEESTTVPAGDTYNYTVPEADAYNPIPGDLLEEPNSGLILNNGTLTIAGTANLTANFSSGSAVGDVSNLVIEKGGIFNVSRYSHMARHKDSVSNLTIEAGGTMNQTKSFYFGCRGESTADIYGTLNITDGNFHIGANYAYADETFRKNAVGIVTVHEGGVVTLTGSGRHISLGRFGSVNTTDKNVGILNIDGGTVTAPSISCADDSGLADKYTNTDYSHAEVNITNGGTLNVGSVTMPYGTGWIVVDGAGSALNVTDTINMYWKDLEVRNGGTVNATKVVSGGYAETAFILDGGTANISGTFTNNGKTANGGGLIIKNGGILNLTGSNTIDGSGEIVISSGKIETSDNTLALSGKTLNYSGGTLPETLNLTKTALNISNTADWNVTNVNDTNGSTLSVTFTPDGTGILLENTTFAGFETADVTLKFAEGVNNQRLTSYAMTADGKITYELAAAKNLVLNRGTDILEADTLSGFASLQTGDVIDVTADITESKTVALPSGNLTIRSNSEGVHTITASGTSPIFSTAGTSALTLENITISGASNHAGVVGGSVITSGNWNIIGGTFSGNSISTPGGGSGDYAAKGGAIYGGTLNLQDVTFTDNIASSGDIGAARAGDSNYVRTQTMGGAVYGSSVTISGNSDFSNNRIETGNVFYEDANGQITRWMDETIGGAVFSENLNIGAKDVQDNVTFSGNVADSTKTTGSASAALGGSIGGAAGANAGTITVTAEDGDKIAFTGNKAESNYSRALGGAVGAGRNDQGSVSIKAEDGGEILFKDNTAVNNKGTMTAMGGAVFGLQGVEAEGAVFENNTAQVNVTNEAGNIVSLFDYDEVTAHSAHGGAIASHNSFGDSVVTVKDSTFTGNKVEVTGDAVEGVQANALGGAVYAAAKDGKGTGTVTLSGTNVFENNSASSTAGDAKGGAIYGEEVAFVGDGSNATFTGNTANGVNNDIYAENSVSITGNGVYSFGGGIVTPGQLSIANANVTFGGQSITDLGSMAVNGADVTFQSGAKLTVNGGTVDNATLNLEGCVDFSGKLTMTNTTANFTAGPTVNGFTTLNADQFSGTVNVGLNVFTVGAMDGNTVTLIDGAKAENVNITNGNLMTNANMDGKTAVTINQDKNGQYGSASLADSKLVGIDFGKDQTSMTVKDFSLIVEGVNSEINLQDFADWLGEETGLETAVGTGYVNVRLDSPFEIMSTDSFIWDFSDYNNGAASLQFATVNIMDSAVPEPTTWALLVLGGLGVFGIARKNRKAKK